MSSTSLTLNRRNQLLLIGLNRPEKRNAFSIEMFHALSDAYGTLEADPELRCGVLHAHGDHFTGGIDLADWQPVLARDGGLTLAPGAIDPLGLDCAHRLTKPIVIAVQGWCLTIGLELMLAADIRIAAQTTRLAQLEVKRGIYAIGGATLRLPQEIGWGNAMRYLLTGDEIPLQEAYRLGLVQEVVPMGRQVDRAVEIAEAIAAQAPLAVRATLRSARIARDQGAAEATTRLRPDMAALLKSDDAREGIASFVERRAARFSGR
jgi:enoyl-CoA hydratase